VAFVIFIINLILFVWSLFRQSSSLREQIVIKWLFLLWNFAALWGGMSGLQLDAYLSQLNLGRYLDLSLWGGDTLAYILSLLVLLFVSFEHFSSRKFKPLYWLQPLFISVLFCNSIIMFLMFSFLISFSFLWGWDKHTFWKKIFLGLWLLDVLSILGAISVQRELGVDSFSALRLIRIIPPHELSQAFVISVSLLVLAPCVKLLAVFSTFFEQRHTKSWHRINFLQFLFLVVCLRFSYLLHDVAIASNALLIFGLIFSLIFSVASLRAKAIDKLLSYILFAANCFIIIAIGLGSYSTALYLFIGQYILQYVVFWLMRFSNLEQNSDPLQEHDFVNISMKGRQNALHLFIVCSFVLGLPFCPIFFGAEEFISVIVSNDFLSGYILSFLLIVIFFIGAAASRFAIFFIYKLEGPKMLPSIRFFGQGFFLFLLLFFWAILGLPSAIFGGASVGLKFFVNDSIMILATENLAVTHLHLWQLVFVLFLLIPASLSYFVYVLGHEYLFIVQLIEKLREGWSLDFDTNLIRQTQFHIRKSIDYVERKLDYIFESAWANVPLWHQRFSFLFNKDDQGDFSVWILMSVWTVIASVLLVYYFIEKL